jgi:hypothetical protein
MILAVALSAFTLLGVPQDGNGDPRRATLEAYYVKQSKGACDGGREDLGIDFESLEFIDVDGDGVEEAIVNGSSCVSGSGGPDIHEVLKLNLDGTISDLTPIEGRRFGDSFHGRPIFDSLACPCNYDVSFNGGILYYTYRDSSGRPDPLVLKFRWSVSRFQLYEVVKNGPRPPEA